MKKVIIITGIVFVVAIGAYIGYNLFAQNQKDDQFRCDCKKAINTPGVLLFDINYEAQSIKNMKVSLNRDTITVDTTKIIGEAKPFTFEYDRRFNRNDTITFVIENKKYVVCGFENHAIIINEKKGLECKLKSAKINNIVQNGNRYNLN